MTFKATRYEYAECLCALSLCMFILFYFCVDIHSFRVNKKMSPEAFFIFFFGTHHPVHHHHQFVQQGLQAQPN